MGGGFVEAFESSGVDEGGEGGLGGKRKTRVSCGAFHLARIYG